jgi:hypothetical protein
MLLLLDSQSNKTATKHSPAKYASAAFAAASFASQLTMHPLRLPPPLPVNVCENSKLSWKNSRRLASGMPFVVEGAFSRPPAGQQSTYV